MPPDNGRRDSAAEYRKAVDELIGMQRQAPDEDFGRILGITGKMKVEVDYFYRSFLYFETRSNTANEALLTIVNFPF